MHGHPFRITHTLCEHIYWFIYLHKYILTLLWIKNMSMFIYLSVDPEMIYCWVGKVMTLLSFGLDVVWGCIHCQELIKINWSRSNDPGFLVRNKWYSWRCVESLGFVDGSTNQKQCIQSCYNIMKLCSYIFISYRRLYLKKILKFFGCGFFSLLHS
jgi:hypothetical protein